MAKKQTQAWKVGDLFLVETVDKMHVIAQVVAQEPQVLNSVSCAFFDCRVKSEDELAQLKDLSLSHLFSALFVTRDLLDNGTWRIIAHRPIIISKEHLPYEHLRTKGYVGAKVIGTANVREFLNAFYGLIPWDDWKDPAYLDGLLISPDKKPKKLKYKNQIELKVSRSDSGSAG
jgi:hypothetical protein